MTCWYGGLCTVHAATADSRMPRTNNNTQGHRPLLTRREHGGALDRRRRPPRQVLRCRVQRPLQPLHPPFVIVAGALQRSREGEQHGVAGCGQLAGGASSKMRRRVVVPLFSFFSAPMQPSHAPAAPVPAPCAS